MEHREVQVAKRTFFGVSDVATVLKSHVPSTGQNQWIVASVVGRARAAAEQREGVVKYATVSFTD